MISLLDHIAQLSPGLIPAIIEPVLCILHIQPHEISL